MLYKQVKELLTDGKTNTKIAKNEVRTYNLSLAPSDQSGVINLCPKASEGCRNLCLYGTGYAKVYKTINNSRINKTLYFAFDRKKFIMQLTDEILAIWGRAKGEKRAFRLNTFSDVDFLGLIKRYTGVDFLSDTYDNLVFYDYTKVLPVYKKYLGSRYHLTFSRSESNEVDVKKVLDMGGNVAVVFGGELPKTYYGYPVIDGDLTDYRPSDPKNVVVGLYPKDIKESTDKHGFVVWDYEMA